MSASTLTRPAEAPPARRGAGRRRHLRGSWSTGLAAASTCGALLALDPVLAPGAWTRTAALAVIACAVLVGFTRTVLHDDVRPTLVGAGMSSLVLLLGALTGDDGAAGIGRVVEDGLTQIRDGVAPLPPGPAVTTFVVAGALAVFLLLDLAAALRAPVVGALAPACLWIPAVTMGLPGSGWSLVWAGGPWLLLVADVAGANRRERAVRTAWSAGLLVVTLALAPVAVNLPGWATGTLPVFGSGGPVALSDDLDLRRDLVGQSGQAVLRYTTAGTDSVGNPVNPTTIGPLRSFTLRSFDGRTWHNDAAGAEVVAVNPGLVLEFGSRPVRQVTAGPGNAQIDVQLLGLTDRYLPLTTAPRTLDAAGRWSYDPLRDEVIGSTTTSGTTYTMVTELTVPTSAELELAGTDGLPSAAPYLAVPTTAHARQIAALATQVVGSAATPYDRAVALQRYFRSGQFTYDERVPAATSSDAVWDFLRNRRGYCVQFATAMTIMARTLGIPARIGVGFLPGQTDDQGVVTVTGRSAHAWPELWFNGVGWVRFEPTPAVQSGAPPTWTVPPVSTSNQPQPDYLNQIGLGSRATVAPTPTAAAVTAPVVPTPGGGGRTLVPVALVVVLLAAVLAALVRRRLRTRTVIDAEHAWALARAALTSTGMGWSDAATPRHVARQVTGALPVGGPRAEQWTSARAAVDSLAGAVERARYAPPGQATTADELRGWLDQLRTALRGLPRSGPSR